jgi:hypothetical protein
MIVQPEPVSGEREQEREREREREAGRVAGERELLVVALANSIDGATTR